MTVQANDIRVVLETLVALGTGFSCASQGEIMKIISLGVSPDRIIFANPTKTPAQIRYALQVGVTKMTFDNEDELYKIKEIFPSAELLIEINCSDPNSPQIFVEKHGVEPDFEAEQLLRLAKSVELKVIGVAFHIGSGTKNFNMYYNGIAYAKKVFNIASKLGYNFNFLDIGGGFTGRNDDVIFEIGKLINEALEEYFPGQAIHIISEPGKYFVDSAFTLAACIHTTKTHIQVNESGEEEKIKMYHINQSIYQALMPANFGVRYSSRILFDKRESSLHPSTIWGSTCDSCDKISAIINLPELKIGDWIYFENTGAYTITISCDFNGYSSPAVHNIIKNKDWLLLTKEVPNPVPGHRFIKGSKPQDFAMNLVNPYSIYNKYF